MTFLSIIIPAYNEANRLPKTLEAVKEFLQTQEFTSEVIVIDDGSSDATADVVRAMMPGFPQLELLVNNPNQGKGGAVKRGMLAAQGEKRLFMDADSSTSVEQVLKLLTYSDEYDVVVGSRYLEPESIKIPQPLKRRIISRVCNLVIQGLVLPGIRDTQCGFKLFSAEATEKVFQRQHMLGWSFDIELLTIAREQGLKMIEVPVDWVDVKHSTLNASRDAFRFLNDLGHIYIRARKNQYR